MTDANNRRSITQHAQGIRESVADARAALMWLLGDGAEDAVEWQASVAKLCRMLSDIERRADVIETRVETP